jgi:hypothetical protein
MRALAAALVALVALACSGPAGARQATLPTPSPTPSPTQQARTTSAGCGQTPVQQGAVPAWLEEAAGHNVPRGLSYVIATPDVAAGFLFANPLRAGHPENPSNKILWVVRTPRQGAALQIDAHPLDAQQPTVHEAQPANSGPGEIYPDGVDVPSPGRWHLTLRWATGRAEVDLEYVPA